MDTSPKILDKNFEDRLARLQQHDLDPKVSGKILSRAHDLLRNREQRDQKPPKRRALPGTLTLIYLTVLALFVLIDVIRIILYIYSP